MCLRDCVRVEIVMFVCVEGDLFGRRLIKFLSLN